MYEFNASFSCKFISEEERERAKSYNIFPCYVCRHKEGCKPEGISKRDFVRQAYYKHFVYWKGDVYFDLVSRVINPQIVPQNTYVCSNCLGCCSVRHIIKDHSTSCIMYIVKCDDCFRKTEIPKTVFMENYLGNMDAEGKYIAPKHYRRDLDLRQRNEFFEEMKAIIRKIT